MRKPFISAILSLLSIRRISYKSTRSDRIGAVRQALRSFDICSAPGAKKLQPGRNEPAEFLQGISLRRVPLCGTGWSRNPTSRGASGSTGGQRVRRRPSRNFGPNGTMFGSFRNRANLVPNKTDFSLLATRPNRNNSAARANKSCQSLFLIFLLDER